MSEPHQPSPRSGLDPTAKGILAATVALTALGGLLIVSVERLDAEPPEELATSASQGESGSVLQDERTAAAQARMGRARSLLLEGRFAAARTALEQLLALDPDHAEALRLRGGAGVEQVLLQDDPELLEAARADLERAVKFAPEDAEAHAYLGLAHGLTGDPLAPAALTSCARALELAPESRTALTARAVLRTLAARAGQAQAASEAVTDLDKAILLAPGDGRLLGCRSAAHTVLGQHERAWRDAAAALAAISGLEARLIPGLVPTELRETVLEGASEVPEGSRGEAARVMATLLESREPETRAAAAFALSRLGPSAIAALPALTQAIDDQDEGVRLAASECLSGLGAEASSAEPALLKALEARSEDHVVHALAAVSSSAGVLTALVRLLQHEDEFLRAAAVQALGSLGPDAARAGLALKKALARDLRLEDPKLAFAVMTSLARILPSREALPALLKGLEHQAPTVRLGAVQALGFLAKGSARARQALESAKDDEHELVRQRAGEELQRLDQ